MATNPETAGSANGGDARRTIVTDIQDQVSSRVHAQKNRAAEGFGSVADVVSHAGSELRSQNETLAALVDGASDQIRRLADHIRQRGAGDLLADVADFGRRRPAVFIGGAFLIGLGVARFLKSSAPRSTRGAQSPYGARFASDPMTSPVRSTPSFNAGGLGDVDRTY